jgi:hypothetical protein
MPTGIGGMAPRPPAPPAPLAGSPWQADNPNGPATSSQTARQANGLGTRSNNIKDDLMKARGEHGAGGALPNALR